MNEQKTRPIASIYAKRKDAPSNEKGHAKPLLAIWPGKAANYATLDEKVAFVQLKTGERIVPGRESEHWLNVYDNDGSRKTSRGDFPAPARESTWPREEAPSDVFDDSDIPF